MKKQPQKLNKENRKQSAISNLPKSVESQGFGGFLLLKNAPSSLAFFGTWLSVISLVGLGPALISIGMILVVVAGIWQALQEQSFQKISRDPVLLCFPIWFLFAVGSIFYDISWEAWLAELQLKLPFLLLPLAYNLLPSFSRKQIHFLLYSFLLLVSVIALLSVGNYLMHFEEMNQQIYYNKSIPIVSGISHIYFGVLLGFACLLSIYWLSQKEIVWWKHERIFRILSLVVNLVSLHLLTSRTAYVVFYLGLMGMCIVYGIRKRWYWQGTLVSLLILLVPYICYHTIPSFHQRLGATFWELDEYIRGEDVSNRSLGPRFVAWEVAVDAWKDAKVWGVGMPNVKEVMKQQYEINQVTINEETRLASPHNQYLQFLLAWGFVGLFVALCTFLAALIFPYPEQSFAFYVFLSVCLFGMINESLLERQIGIAFFLMFFILFRRHKVS